ncbi:MAG TPA: hypothetical protein VMU51_10505 [Mycobacteriales bacterium]|nr:hypothetical protein [Mycobacteriales bacterium]
MRQWRPRLAARSVHRRVRRSVDGLAGLPAGQVALRGAVAGTGGLALLLAAAGQLLGAGLVALLGLPALLSAVLRPDGGGPAVVLGAAATAWAMRYGVAAPPLGATLALAALLYLHHLTAALGAAMPVDASIDPQLLLRWGAHAAGVLALTGLAATGLRLGGEPAASPVLEVAGLVGAVALAGLLVTLARTPRRPGPQLPADQQSAGQPPRQ